ncbi:DDE_3 domain-containing protein [Trichonephila clavipes]|nr:DDE_3 domain-containing protein [Trichonephila clavipes]
MLTSKGNEKADSLANEARTLEALTSSTTVFDANAFNAKHERFIVDFHGVECSGTHTALVVRQFLAANGVVTLDSPPYSPDLAPADLFLFPRLKSALKVKRFTDITDIQKNVTAELKVIPKELFYRSFQDLYTH